MSLSQHRALRRFSLKKADLSTAGVKKLTCTYGEAKLAAFEKFRCKLEEGWMTEQEREAAELSLRLIDIRDSIDGLRTMLFLIGCCLAGCVGALCAIAAK